MPNPASKVTWNGNYVFGSHALLIRPQEAAVVAAVIAAWASIEMNLGRIFSALVGSKQPVTISMYLAIESFNTRKLLLNTAAKEVLTKKNLEVLEVGLKIILIGYETRNKFAHQIWGASMDQNLQALFLVKPADFIKLNAKQSMFDKRINDGRTKESKLDSVLGHQPVLDRNLIQVYRMSDLLKAHEQLDHAYRISDALKRLVNPNSKQKLQIYQWLSSDTQIRQEIENRKVRARRAIAHATPKEFAPRVRKSL